MTDSPPYPTCRTPGCGCRVYPARDGVQYDYCHRCRSMGKALTPAPGRRRKFFHHHRGGADVAFARAALCPVCAAELEPQILPGGLLVDYCPGCQTETPVPPRRPGGAGRPERDDTREAA